MYPSEMEVHHLECLIQGDNNPIILEFDENMANIEQIMKSTGPNGKTANVLTAWIKENESSEPRLVTLYVTDKEGE